MLVKLIIHITGGRTCQPNPDHRLKRHRHNSGIQTVAIAANFRAKIRNFHITAQLSAKIKILNLFNFYHGACSRSKQTKARLSNKFRRPLFVLITGKK